MCQADAPDPAKIPEGSLLGVTVVMLTCSYKEAEFIRVGYYVNNEYEGTQQQQLQQVQVAGAVGLAAAAAGARSLSATGAGSSAVSSEDRMDEDDDIDMEDDAKENDGANNGPSRSELLANLDKVTRTILSDKPRVTRFAIDW